MAGSECETVGRRIGWHAADLLLSVDMMVGTCDSVG